MGEEINRLYDEYQEDLLKQEKRLKLLNEFKTDDELDRLMDELSKKDLIINETN